MPRGIEDVEVDVLLAHATSEAVADHQSVSSSSSSPPGPPLPPPKNRNRKKPRRRSTLQARFPPRSAPHTFGFRAFWVNRSKQPEEYGLHKDVQSLSSLSDAIEVVVS